jgi:histidine triad (HIT) family protein
MDCIFCKIVKKEIPSSIVYEDKNTLAFLDISPLNRGHALVIPKKHYETIADIPESEIADLMKVVRKVGIATQKAVGAHGLNITQNNGKAAEQFVPHMHFHLIPRFEEDGIYMTHPKKKYAEGEMEETRKRIADNI